MDKKLKKQLSKLRLQFGTAKIDVRDCTDDFKLTAFEYKEIYRQITACKSDDVVKISDDVELELLNGNATIINMNG